MLLFVWGADVRVLALDGIEMQRRIASAHLGKEHGIEDRALALCAARETRRRNDVVRVESKLIKHDSALLVGRQSEPSRAAPSVTTHPSAFCEFASCGNTGRVGLCLSHVQSRGLRNSRGDAHLYSG